MNKFWSSFARKQWEKEPVVFKKAAVLEPSGIFSIDANHIFELLVRYCDLCRERDSIEGLKFYVDGVRLESFEAIEHLPLASDKSLQGYHQRMSRQFGDYGLVCDELMQVMQDPTLRNGETANLLNTFMEDLYKHVGLPNRFAEIGLYLGNYRKTPFGVHVDRCGVFSFPVVGKKTFRLWDPDYVEKNPELKEAFQYDEFKKKSELLNAAPGDIAYWPSSHWHIAEGDGSFSATWSIGVWVDRPVTDVVTTLMGALANSNVTKTLGRRASLTALPLAKHDEGFVRELPKDLSQAATALAKLSKNEIQDVMLQWWIEHSSSRGFRVAKAVNSTTTVRVSDSHELTRTVLPGDTLLGNPDQPILWTKLSTKQIAWAARGNSTRMKFSKEIISLIENLNSGRPVRVTSKLAKPSLQMLQTLVSQGEIVFAD